MFTFTNLWELSNHTLFNDIKLPKGTYDSVLHDGSYKELSIEMDKEILINSIFDEVAELQPLTIDVDVMKMKINNFFLKNNEGFNRLLSINLITYNPIENTDRYHTETTKYNRKGANNDTSTGVVSDTISDVNNHNVSAYDSDVLQPSTRDSRDMTDKQTTTNVNDRTENINDNTEHTLRTHGNIGVTTNQQMLTEEKNYWIDYSVYEIIAEKFMFSLCLTCETYN